VPGTWEQPKQTYNDDVLRTSPKFVTNPVSASSGVPALSNQSTGKSAGAKHVADGADARGPRGPKIGREAVSVSNNSRSLPKFEVLRTPMDHG
jgi:hypothetical protein